MKKYIIILILTVAIFFSSSYIQQRKAHAILPVVMYVTIGLAISFLVGRYIYKTIGEDIYVSKVINYDSSTGNVDIEWNQNQYTLLKSKIMTSAGGKNVYPEVGGWEDNPYGDIRGDTLVEVVEFEEYQGSIISDTDIIDVCDSWNYVDYCTLKEGLNTEGIHAKVILGYDADGIDDNIYDTALIDNPPLIYDPNEGIGGVFSGEIDGFPIELYEAIEDVPLPPPSCIDGIQNQDETGIDCGGVCPACPPPPETCSDGIMNQDETGIDYGGVCGTGDTVSTPSGTFTDANQDGIDDISGLADDGTIPAPTPSPADSSTYDTSLPGDVSEVGETNWTSLITGYLSSNPLVTLATGNQIDLSGSSCVLTANVFSSDIVIDFCSVESLIDLIGTFVLGLMAIRSVFIALGV
jgi:hypothetical protein